MLITNFILIVYKVCVCVMKFAKLVLYTIENSILFYFRWTNGVCVCVCVCNLYTAKSTLYL